MGRHHDEIVISGPTQVAEIRSGAVHMDEWWPEDFGVKTQPDETIKGGSPAENARLLLSILQGERSPYRKRPA